MNRRMRSFRAAQWDAGHRHCVWCRGALQWTTATPYAPDAATLEHLIPRMFGGSDHKSNLALACYECNSTLGNFIHSIRDWLELRDGELVMKEAKVEMRAMYGGVLRGDQQKTLPADALPRLWWDGLGAKLRRVA